MPPPALMLASDTVCWSVALPVPPVNASSTDGGSVTLVDRYCLPSSVTVMVPAATVIPTWWLPVRSAGTFAAVAR